MTAPVCPTAAGESWARAARGALLDTPGATLHVHGMGRPAGPYEEVLLHDDGGTPTFLCPGTSAIARAATLQCVAVLSIPLGGVNCVNQVMLAGRLIRAGAQRVDGVEFALARMQLGSVVVEIDDPDRATFAQHQVPLAQYRTPAPDPVDCRG